MIPWIQVYSNLIKHPKTTNLAEALNLSSKDASPNAVAAGMLVSLWLWAAQNATNGDLSGCSDRAIAEAAEYRRKPTAFVEALIKTKWLDPDRKLHDWDEYASLLQDSADRQKENTRERVRRHREKRKSTVTQGGLTHETQCNGVGNVTVTQSNAPTLPYLTLPNLTVTDIGDGDDSACARKADENDLAGIGLKPGEYLGVTKGAVQAVKRETERLMQTIGRKATPTDFRNVFCYAFRGNGGGFTADPEAAGLLEYALEQAAMSGAPGNWRYIGGVLETLSAREIRTRAQAEEYDRRRLEDK